MKRKLVSILVGTAMISALLAGCGGSDSSTAASGSSAAEAASEAVSEAVEEEAAASSASEVTSESAEAVSESAAAEEDTGAAEEAEEVSADALVINPDNMLEGTPYEGIEAKDAYEFEIIVKAFQASYYQAVIEGANDAAADLGVTVNALGPNTESDIADQVNMLNSAVNGNLDGVAIAPCDNASVIDSLNNAKKAGVPVVYFDSLADETPEGTVMAAVVTDSLAAGGVGGQEMWNAIKGRVGDQQVQVGMLAQDAVSSNHQLRGLGFINGLIDAAKADGVSVAVTGNDWFVGAVEDSGDASTAQVVINCAVPAQSNIDMCATEASAIMNKDGFAGIYGSGQLASEGIIQANDNLAVLGSDPENDAIMVGFDAGTILKGAVADGTVYGAITQMPYAEGYYTVAALVAAANGDKVVDMPLPGYFYNAANMEDELIAPNLYE